MSRLPPRTPPREPQSSAGFELPSSICPLGSRSTYVHTNMNARSASPLQLAIALRVVERARTPELRAAAIRRYVALRTSKGSK
jgi:transglutaminase-like putative cysteine protease